MANIINAIGTLIKRSRFNLTDSNNAANRMNSRGDALETYIKNPFADTFDCSEPERLEKWSEIFSYTGNSNNPPDFMLKGGDAVEVKKIEAPDAALALNSSYPKHTLQSSSPLILNACREAENWTEKDIIYAVGVAGGNNLKHLCMVYGRNYCAADKWNVAHRKYFEIVQCKVYNSSLRGKFDVELSTIPALKCFDNRNPKCDRLFCRRV